MKIRLLPFLFCTAVAFALPLLLIAFPRAQSQQVTACGTVINAPGDYQLANDLASCSGNGVTISASNVNFDLAGFTITGISTVASCNTVVSQIGINVTAASQVQIGGGTVAGFVDGIDLGASNSTVRGLTLANNCFFGLVVSNAADVLIEANTVTGTGTDGVLLLNADAAIMQSNRIANNGRFGVLIVSGSDQNTIRDNAFSANGAAAGGAGIGVVGGTNTQIFRNVVSGNLQGIALFTNGNAVEGNIASENQTVGISVSGVAANNRLEGNTATANSTNDLMDVNPICGTNIWQNNFFVTDMVAGVNDGGPETGCIRGPAALSCADGACTGDAKPILLAQTGAVDMTGSLPNIGRVTGPVTVGGVTLSGRSLSVGAGSDPSVQDGDWTALLPEADIALEGGPLKELDITFQNPVFTAGFDFVEPETGPNVGAKFSDGRFNLTLKLGDQSLRELAFSPPNDVATFVSVVSDVPFDKIELRTLVGANCCPKFGVALLGRIYGGPVPVLTRAYDVLPIFGEKPSSYTLYKVDPADGFKSGLSFFDDGRQGPLGVQPFGITVDASRQILVADYGAGSNGKGALFRIDPRTGQRLVFHDFGNPNVATQGTPLGENPAGVAVDASGRILVADLDAGTNQQGALFRIDPVTKVRTLLSDFGKGQPPGNNPIGVAVEASGQILVIDPGAGTDGKGALFRINPVNNARTLLSDFGKTAQGNLGAEPGGIALEASGNILVVDSQAGLGGILFRIDPKTGFRTVLSDFAQAGQGAPAALFPQAVTVEPTGSIIVVSIVGSFVIPALVRVDPVSGFRTQVTPILRSDPLLPRGVAILSRY